MNFDFDNSTQTNTALTTTGTSYTYVNSNDLSTKQNLLDVLKYNHTIILKRVKIN
jgi:hypothetical protein